MSDTSAVGLEALCGAFIGLTTITIVLRFYGRYRQKLPFLADDWLMIPAWLSFIGSTACYYMATKYKILGYSTYDLTPEETQARAMDSSKLQIALGLMLVMCLGCTKASALFFYKRIFCAAGHKATLNIVVVCSIVVVALWVVVFMFLTGFQCGTHFSALWDGNYLEYCTISFPFLYGEAVSDFLLDVWVLVLPIPAISKLQTSLRRKLSFGGIFLLACVGLAASIAKMIVYIEVENAGKEVFVKFDQQRMITKAFFYLMLEAGISLVAVNLPSIWLLFTLVKPEAMLQSVRSALSLASIESRDSNKSRGTQPQNTDAIKSNGSVESTLPFRGETGESSAEIHADSYKLQDLERQATTGEIHVKHTVEQSSASVKSGSKSK